MFLYNTGSFFYLKYGVVETKHLLNAQSGLAIQGSSDINEEIDNVVTPSVSISETFVYECSAGQALNTLLVVTFLTKVELLESSIASYRSAEEQKG